MSTVDLFEYKTSEPVQLVDGDVSFLVANLADKIKISRPVGHKYRIRAPF